MNRLEHTIKSLKQELAHFEKLNINPTVRRNLKAKIERLEKKQAEVSK